MTFAAVLQVPTMAICATVVLALFATLFYQAWKHSDHISERKAKRAYQRSGR